MIKKIFAILIMLGSLITLSSCSSFIMDDEIKISNIDYELMKDGQTKITISYLDGIDPTIFYIPKGESGVNGVNGNGIKAVTSRQSDDKKNTIIKIEFTSPDMKPVEVMVNNGISIKSISSSLDNESGNTSLIINFSDGSKSDPIIIPKGEKGDAGVGIEKFEAKENEDGSQTLIFYYTDGNKTTCQIPAPKKGDDGNSITGIFSYEEDDKYYITFEFSEGEPKVISFYKPEAPNTWLSGNGEPNNDIGRVGDFYFNLINKTIHQKKQDGWVIIVDLSANDEYYVISFDLNDVGGPKATLPSEFNTQYFIGRGKYFITEGYQLPIPTRDGYSFAGWYSSKTPNINSGAFTDLTPVFSNLTLYAKWIKE